LFPLFWKLNKSNVLNSVYEHIIFEACFMTQF
jgi:hypothetical protein